jgi:hypothetical protein
MKLRTDVRVYLPFVKKNGKQKMFYFILNPIMTPRHFADIANIPEEPIAPTSRVEEAPQTRKKQVRSKHQ